LADPPTEKSPRKEELEAAIQSPELVHRHHAVPQAQPFGVTNGKFAMWLFLGSDGMSFMGLIATYVALRLGNLDTWPDPTKILNIPLTALNTFILICSSVTMVKAFAAAQEGNVAGLKKWLAFTMLGGMIFLGIQAYEYYHLIHIGLTPTALPTDAKYELLPNASTLFGATFYACTCFHGCHVLSGVIYIGVSLLFVTRGKWSTGSVEILGLYWHFVDLVWIVIFTIIYLF
jgi:cytochrome c oxidase subunit III